MRLRHSLLFLPAAFVPMIAFLGCSPQARLPMQASTEERSVTRSTTDELPAGGSVLDRMNERLAAAGSNVRVARVELVAVGGSGAVGHTLLANDRDLQSEIMFAPADPRRNASGNAITYLVNGSRATPNGSVSSAQADAAIDRAMATWNAASNKVRLVRNAYTGTDPDVVDGILGFGSMAVSHEADVVHGGWMPPEFFDALLPGSSEYTLAMTFVLAFIPVTDIDGDHQFDVSRSEIYYNDRFAWGVDADPPVADIETVALHEAGHGLCHSHFGMIVLPTEPDGTPRLDENGVLDVQCAPYAVMNAIIFGRHQLLEGTDQAQHSLKWGSWPNK